MKRFPLANARLILSAALLMSCLPVQAQAINARWLGAWQSEDGKSRLSITDRQFTIGASACRWSNTVARGVKQCTAYYEGTLTRAQIQKSLIDSEKEALDLARQSGSTPAQVKAVQEQFRRNRQVIERISNDSFRLIQTNSPDKEMGSGDCGDVYFLDKDSVYNLAQCAPAPDAFTLTAYRKVP